MDDVPRQFLPSLQQVMLQKDAPWSSNHPSLSAHQQTVDTYNRNRKPTKRIIKKTFSVFISKYLQETMRI
jgi:hypothetical protein